jgi:hypothetical protein
MGFLRTLRLLSRYVDVHAMYAIAQFARSTPDLFSSTLLLPTPIIGYYSIDVSFVSVNRWQGMVHLFGLSQCVQQGKQSQLNLVFFPSKCA